MPIIKRVNKYQALRELDVFIEEKGISSEYFNVTGMPAEIPQGKSTFLITGSPFLKNSVELKIEMIDSSGQTVYMEPVANYLESEGRRVSIEVYPDTAAGVAKLYILGELKKNYKDFQQPQQPSIEITDLPFVGAGSPPPQEFLDQFTPDVPPNFQGVYNVRFEMPVKINTTIPNTEPILFYKQPRLTVREIVKGFVINNIPSSSYDVSGSLSINILPSSQQEISPPAEPEPGQPAGLSESDRDDVGKNLAIFKNRRSTKRDPYRNSLFGKRGRLMRRSSPEVDKSTGIINSVTATPENSVNNITSTFIGETLRIDNIQVDTSKLPAGMQYTVTGSYTTQIKKVLNSNTFVPMDDFSVDLPNGGKFPADITNATFTASIHPTPGFTISTTDFRSFADITIGNLRTFSGDVFKAVVYGKSQGSLGDFEPMYEAFIESAEVLVDKLSPTGFTSTGFFFTQSIVDSYWTASGGYGTAVESDDVLIDGVTISGSNYEMDSKINFRTRHLYELEPNTSYNVEFNTYFYTAEKVQQTGNVENDALLEVYVTGSKGGDKELLGRVDIPSMVPEGKIDGIFKTFVSAPDSPKMALEFHVKAGSFILQDVSVRPASETNFNPDYHRVIVPMPHPMPVKPDKYDFLVELFDLNNNASEAFAVSENVEFTGAPLVIAGAGNMLSGSMMLGTGMELYGGSAFLRTRGYRGMEYSRANNLGGFMVFSGSIGGPSAVENLITSSEDYDGVGFEVVDFHDSNNPKFLKFGTNPSRFEVITDQFFFGKPRTQTNSQFVSGSGGQIEISSSFFHLTPQGDVTGSAILLGSKPDNFLQFVDDQLTVKGNLSVNQITTPAEIGGSPSTVANASSSITPQGFARFASASIAGFEVSTDEIKSSSNALRLKSGGQITGSNVQFTGGRIANWDIIGDTLSSVNPSGKGITLDADASTPIIKIEEDSDNKLELYHTTSTNWGIKGISGGDTIFRLGNTNEIAGWLISNTQLKGGTGASTIALTPGAGIHAGADLLNAAPFSVTSAGVMKAESGTVAGWTIGSDTLVGGDLILEKNGTIRSSGYQTDVAGSGFILTAASGGFLEVENAKIRGTLATAVFEKESVNAVGGQLYVANSTTLTGSALVSPEGNHTAAQTTMSVVNASGFAPGEILVAKKVHDTGFNTEYLLVESSSRNNASSDNDQSGLLYVQRAYGQGTTGASGSLGGPAGNAASYSGSQVLVSTGKQGTGYVRINANPNDQATPYIDIVERTGAGLYDVELKARLGDLSGVAGSRNVPLGFTGFGLMSEVAFLSGSQIKLEAPTFVLGDLNQQFVSGSNSKMEISSSNFHLQPDGQLLVGDKSNGKYIEWNNSDLIVRGDISVDNLRTPSTIGGSAPTHLNASASISASGEVAFRGEFFLGDENFGFISGSNRQIRVSGSDVVLETPSFILGGESQFLSGSNGNLEITSSMFHLEPTGRFAVGNTATAFTTRSGSQFIDGTLIPTYSQSTFDTLDINNTLYRFDWVSSTPAVDTPNEQANASNGWYDSYMSYFGTPLIGTHTAYFNRNVSSKMLAIDDPQGTGANTLANFSISFWVNIPSSGLGDDDTLIAYGNDNQGFSIEFRTSSSKLAFAYYLDGNVNGPQILLLFNTLASNTWHHLGVVVSTRQQFIQLFANGEMVNHCGTHEFRERELNLAHGGLGPGIEYSSGARWSIGYREQYIRKNITDGNDGDYVGSDTDFITMYMQDLRVVQYERPAKSFRAMYNFVTNRKDAPTDFENAIVATTGSIDINSINYTLGSSATAFVRHDSGGLEISSSNFHVSQSGDVTAVNQRLSGISEADYFSYRNNTIKNDQNVHDGYYLYYLKGGVPYTCLYLVGDRSSQRQRDESPFRRSFAASMVRINDAPKWPIGMILTPGNRGGAQVILEASATFYLAKEKGSEWRGASGIANYATSSLLNPRTFDQNLEDNYHLYLADTFSGNSNETILEEQFSSTRYGFDADPNDEFGGTHFNSFYTGSVTLSNTNSDNTITGSFTYDNVGTVFGGNRLVLVKSRFDFRPIAFTGKSFSPLFQEGLTVSTVEGAEIRGGTRLNFNAARNAADVSNEYLRGTNGVTFTANRGYAQPRPGSVTALTINGVDNTDALEGTVYVRKNGSNLVSITLSGLGTGHFNLFKTFARNGSSNKFVAGDMLNVYLEASMGTVDYPICTFEVTYDT